MTDEIQNLVSVILDRTKENKLIFEVLTALFYDLINDDKLKIEHLKDAIQTALMEWDINWRL